MIKKIEPFLFCLIVGFIMGKFMFNQYDQSEAVTAYKNTNVLFFLRSGIYDTKELMEQNVTNIPYYIYKEENDKYIVYVGITKDESNLEKLTGYFKEKKYDITVEEVDVSNEEFLDSFNKYEELLKETTDTRAIETIENKVLTNYKEFVISD